MKIRHGFTLIVLLLAAGCSSPGETVDQYLGSVYRGQFDNSYQYICNADRQKVDLDQYREQMEQALPEFVRSLYNHYDWQITSVDIQQTKATVKVQFTYPNFPKMLGEIFGSNWRRAYTDPAAAEMADRQLRTLYAEKPPPLLTADQTYKLVKENMQWLLFFDWAAKQEE